MSFVLLDLYLTYLAPYAWLPGCGWYYYLPAFWSTTRSCKCFTSFLWSLTFCFDKKMFICFRYMVTTAYSSDSEISLIFFFLIFSLFPFPYHVINTICAMLLSLPFLLFSHWHDGGTRKVISGLSALTLWGSILQCCNEVELRKLNEKQLLLSNEVLFLNYDSWPIALFVFATTHQCVRSRRVMLNSELKPLHHSSYLCCSSWFVPSLNLRATDSPLLHGTTRNPRTQHEG